MQFFTIALFAGAAMAWTTVYETDIVTITSCHPTVTDCPAHSTVTKTTSHVAPQGTASASAHPQPYSNGTSPHYTAPAAPHGTAPAASHSIATGPAVVTVTVNACPSSSTPVVPNAPITLSSVVTPYPSSPAVTTAPKPSGTAAPSASNVVPTTPVFTAGAPALSGSVLLAAFAGLAAVLFV